MKEQLFNTKGDVNWDKFKEKLTDYVRLELAGEAAEEIYPELAFYIQHSPQCEEAYDREFRRQGLAKPIETLLTTERQQAVMATMHHIFGPEHSGFAQTPNPNWIMKTIEYGQIWLNQMTQQWQQLDIALLPLTFRPELTTASSGFLHESRATGYTLLIDQEEEDFQLTISVEPDPTRSGQCQLIASIVLFKQLGDFSGVQMTLLWGDNAPSIATDIHGKATFTHLPADQLGNMQLKVKLPD